MKMTGLKCNFSFSFEIESFELEQCDYEGIANCIETEESHRTERRRLDNNSNISSDDPIMDRITDTIEKSIKTAIKDAVKQSWPTSEKKPATKKTGAKPGRKPGQTNKLVAEKIIN